MSDHFNYVSKRVIKIESQEEETEQTEDHHPYENDAADTIRASCDRRLSRAAREIVKQKLLQALVYAIKTTATVIPITIDAAAVSSPEMSDLSISSGHSNLTLQDILATDNPAKFSVWELLESVLVARNSNSTSSSTTCWLQGQHDVLRYHEEHVSIIPVDLQGRRGIDTPTANRRHVNQKRMHPHWYQCLLCGKVFSSRFYLDRHLETHHRPPPDTKLSNDIISHQDDDSSTTFWICPSTDWCGNFLSLSACHEMALALEPHYGPGSQGRRIHDRFLVENQLWKEAHQQPCSTSGMQTATAACRNMIQSCFFQQQPTENADNSDNNKENSNDATALFTISQTVAQVLDTSLCSTLSCPDRLHRLFFKTKTGGDLVMRHVHEWEEEWIYWAEEHHEAGWVGLILLVLLAIWYANALFEHLPRASALVPSYFRGNKRKIPKAQGSRLLRKSPSKTTVTRGKKAKEN